MRKLFLFTLLITAGSILYAAENFHIELYGDLQDNQKTGAIKLSTPVIELRTANQPDRQNFGFLFTTSKLFKKLSFDVKYGNLSPTGTISKLNNPELSNGTSPFSNSPLSVTGIAANLPGYSSFSKPESTFLQLRANQLTKHPLSINLNLFLSPENSSPVFSANLSDKFFSNQLILATSFTTGRFNFADNNSSAWYLESPYYTAGSHLCSLLQFSAELKNKTQKNSFYAAAQAAAYETPFGPETAVYRTDLKLTIKQTEIYAAAFLNEYEDTFTSSQKKLVPSIQLKGGLQIKKPLLLKKQKLIFSKFGINAFSKINLTNTEHPLRFNAGILLSSDETSFSITASADTLLLSSSQGSQENSPQDMLLTSFSAQIKNSWYFKHLTPTITLSGEKDFYDSSNNKTDEMKYKLQLNMTNNAKHKISGNCTFSFSVKNNEPEDKKLSAGLSCRLNFNHVTIIGKMSFSSKPL